MFDDCFSLYRNIIKNSTDEFETERKTNIRYIQSLFIKGLLIREL